jgi:hypothetical protein
VNEYIEVRCGAYGFLVPSTEVDSIEVLKGIPEPFGGRRALRESLLLDGRVLAGNQVGGAPEHGVTLRVAERGRLETRIFVDKVGSLIRCDPAAIKPLPHALEHLRAYFLGVWREQALQEYLFCVRPRKELALQRFFWRRRIRRAVMTIRRDVVDRKAST